MNLDLLPAHSRIFADANVLAFHLAGHHPLSPACTRFLERGARREISILTSANVVAEVIHRAMVYEALQLRPERGSALISYLKTHPELVRELTQHLAVPSQLAAMNVDIKPIDHVDLHGSNRFRRDLGLMTNDSLLLAVMQRHKVTYLATHDQDFKRAKGIRVWAPVPSAP